MLRNLSMPQLSLIIPCYNEEKNIKLLFSAVSKLQKKVNLEFVIVNNGSKDKTEKEIYNNKRKIKNIKIVKIKKNVGFGHGVKKGIQKSTSKIICYTHGDLQIKLDTVAEACRILKKEKKENIFIKGRRLNRPIFDNFFTYAMSLMNSLIFRRILLDIHAQPNLFKKSMIKNVNNLPDNMLLDLYIFLCAKINNYKIMRFNVKFLDRKYGKGSNDNLIKKIKYSLLSIFSSLRLLIYGKF